MEQQPASSYFLGLHGMIVLIFDTQDLHLYRDAHIAYKMIDINFVYLIRDLDAFAQVLFMIRIGCSTFSLVQDIKSGLHPFFVVVLILLVNI